MAQPKLEDLVELAKAAQAWLKRAALASADAVKKWSQQVPDWETAQRSMRCGGLCATIEAAKRGAKVTIIDKEGCNSAKASSGMNGANTQAQRDQGITDSVEKFIEEKPQRFVELVHTLAEQSRETHEWLKSLGLHLSDVVQLGGHSTARCLEQGVRLPTSYALWIILRCYNVDVELETSFGRTPAMLAMEADVDGSHAGVLDLLRRPYLAWADRKVLPGIGSERTCASGRLAGKILETELKDQVTIRTKSSFKELLIEDGRVMGLNFEHENGTEQLRGTVVLTAGGYANDHADSSLLDLHTPALAKLPTTNGPFATGDAWDDVIKALVKQEAGVKTTLMDKVKQPNFHTKFLAPEALRGSGGILLCHGKRFANELGRRDYLTEEMFKHCKPLFDKEDPEAREVQCANRMADVGTVEAAAEAMGTSAEVLKKTLEDYNEAAERGQDKFGKKVFPVRFPSTAHLYVAFVTPTLHYCMGGLAINVRTEVLHSDGQPIPNLYGAGEVTGGVHGNNRLGGNSLLECAVFGRMAGAQAAEKAKDGPCDTERGSAGGA
eukprot:g24494.t1